MCVRRSAPTWTIRSRGIGISTLEYDFRTFRTDSGTTFVPKYEVETRLRFQVRLFVLKFAPEVRLSVPFGTSALTSKPSCDGTGRQSTDLLATDSPLT